MKNILLSLAVVFGMHASSQNMDSVMFLHNTDNTVDTISIYSLDSITFGYVTSTNYTYSPDFTPPSGADSTATDLESPAYFRMMTATSPDGINWTATGTVVSDQGNVPDFINRNDTLFLYYTGYQVGSMTNTTVVAISIDNGNNWVFKHINLLGYSSSPLTTNGDPDVILNPDNSIRMFITTGHNGMKSVLCYESTNGIDFNFIDVAAHSSTDDIFDSNTFFFNGNWHMYAINSTNTTHWYLTSTDGVHFTQNGTYDFIEGGNAHFASNGFINGSSYRMFSSFLPNQDLYSFTSNDGVSWTFEGTSLNFGTVSGESSYLKDPAITHLSVGSWLMVYVTRIP